MPEINYNSVLALAHFQDPDFARDCRQVFRHLDEAFPGFPEGRENAKIWETVQGWRALRDHGAIGAGAEILGVGAGYEPLIYWLTKHARRVFATDLYAADVGWQEASSNMLNSPADFCPTDMPFEERRLVVQHMNALDLKYEDESFDGVFSCGSVEHFGRPEDVARGAREMARVLKPGGILSLSTEFRLSGPDGLGIPGTILFTEAMLAEFIVEPSGLVAIDEFQGATGDMIEYAYPLPDAVKNGVRPRSICLTQDDYVWTSVSLCLRKPR